jgi:hypothetical protein
VIAATSGAAALLVSTSRPPSLAASPARVTLSVAESRTIRVTNSGGGIASVDVAPAGFALDLRGRPRIVRRTDAAALRLEVKPRRLTLQPGEATTLTVSAVPAPHVRVGDHPALVLLTTQRRGAGLGVRMQIGIVVIVRVPGAVLHRLELHGLRVRRGHRADLLELSVVNRGNVTERLTRERVRVSLRRRGRVIARLRAMPRELFPRSRATETFRYRGRLRGPATALVEVVRPANGMPILRRTFRIRL